MAKQKSEENKLTDATELLIKEIDKDYGKGVIIDGLSALEQKKMTIPISPSLDIICGGIEEGSWVGITGPPKGGKTTTMLSFAANCQKKEYGSRPIFYSKVEGRLSTVHLKGIRDLDLSPTKFNIIQSQKGKILTAQDHLTILTQVVRTVPNAVIIIDSISALCDEKEMTGGIGTQTRGGGAKILSQFCSLVNQVVPLHNTIVIGITHLISNTSGMGAPLMEKAARAWQYQCDYQLRIKQKTPWKSGNDTIGLIVKWICNTSKSVPMGMTIDSYIRFGVGTDKLYELLTFGMTTGLIKKAGAWLTLSFMENHLDVLGVKKWNEDAERMVKAQGGEQLYQMLIDNPSWTQILEEEIKKLASGLAGTSGEE